MRLIGSNNWRDYMLPPGLRGTDRRSWSSSKRSKSYFDGFNKTREMARRRRQMYGEENRKAA